MRVIVLGAGVVGVTAAWYLREAGHEVKVVDRGNEPATETSFANGGQISASYAEPWANPGTPRKILKWLGREDAPLLFRLRADWQQWCWGVQFLLECAAARTRRNTVECLNLALYSRSCLKELRAATGIEYDQLVRGILHFYMEERELEEAIATAAVMREYGCDREVKSTAGCVAIEPALAACADRLVGGVFTSADESGDARKFTLALAAQAHTRGVEFLWQSDVRRLVIEGGSVAGVDLRRSGREERLVADRYVVALGSYSPLLLRPIGVPAAIYPVKGYSITVPVGAHRGAPTVSLTDVERKLVITRLHDRLRVAGTAELAGYSTTINKVRCDAIVDRTFELFPDAGDREGITAWAGLRPATPSNVPLVGGTRYGNLFLDTGHGTLGWTMACGSGRALADLMSGRKPAVDFAFQGVRS